MTVVVRSAREADLEGFWVADRRAFGFEQGEEYLAGERTVVTAERTLVADDQGVLVGGTTSHPFRLTLSPGADVPVCGVAHVHVAPTHRRRGLVSRLLAEQLERAVAAGEVAAALMASEGGIYRRFGYGVATWRHAYVLDAAGGAFDGGLDVPGRFAFVEPEEVPDRLGPFYDRWRLTRPGAMSRSASWWRLVVDPHQQWKSGGRRTFCAHLDDHGEVDGYVSYARRDRSHEGLLRQELDIRELVAADPVVEAALWRFCLDVDLVSSVSYWLGPPDPVVRHRLADPRQLRTTSVADLLWVRVLDVPAVLGARGYAADGTVVLEVADHLRPATGGRFRVEAEGGRGSCAPSDDGPELALDVADLGSVSLGGTSWSDLVAAGRVLELRPGAAARADALFAAHPAPHCTTLF